MANAKRLTLAQFAAQQGFNMVSKVRANVNGYLFVTLLSSDDPSKAENVYFGKRFAAEGGYKIGDNLTVANVFATFAEYEDGREPQWKLTDKDTDATATLVGMGYQSI